VRTETQNELPSASTYWKRFESCDALQAANVQGYIPKHARQLKHKKKVTSIARPAFHAFSFFSPEML